MANSRGCSTAVASRLPPVGLIGAKICGLVGAGGRVAVEPSGRVRVTRGAGREWAEPGEQGAQIRLHLKQITIKTH